MTIHVNIGEAKTRLSELVAAAQGGEEVVIASDGPSGVRLVPIEPNGHHEELSHEEIVARRLAFFGSMKGKLSDHIDWLAPTFTDEELAEFEKPF